MQVKRNGQKAISLVLALLLSFCLMLPVSASTTDSQLVQAVNKTASYLQKTVPEPQLGSGGGEWVILGLARSGVSVPQTYWDHYYAAVEDYVKECKGVLHSKRYTEYSRVTVALSAIGADPTNVAGYDLLYPLGDFDTTAGQGLNGVIWALIALDSGDYDVPVNSDGRTQATRQMYIDRILSRQLSDGGWNLSGSGRSDTDITAMALQALAKYQSQSKVKTAVEKGLSCLSELQQEDGGYGSYGVENSESCAQVVVALCELGISLSDKRFVKNGATVLDKLLTYQNTDGSFRYREEDTASSARSTEHAFYGLVAALRARQGKSPLYQMDDVTIRVSGSPGAVSAGLPGKHDDVKRVAVSVPGRTFADISGHANQTAIEALASRTIINGMGNDTFQPDALMIRAQFAAIVVQALGLDYEAYAGKSRFTDVSVSAWYCSYINAAADYGLIEGRSATKFAPNENITVQEAACIVARAAKLCGMDTSMNTAAIRNVLAQFGDYVTISDWAQESVAFCFREDIMDQSVWEVQPKRAVTRCEIAQMIYNLLDSANLL